MYKVNDVVVHENGGVYRIVSIGKPDFVKGQEEYYTMKSVWDDSSMIYVKINNDKVYMRPVISKAEARSFPGSMRNMIRTTRNGKRKTGRF